MDLEDEYTVTEVKFFDQWRMQVEWPWLWVRSDKRRMYGVSAVLVLIFALALTGFIARGNPLAPFDPDAGGWFFNVPHALLLFVVGFYIALVVVLFPVFHMIGKIGGPVLMIAGVGIIGLQIYFYLRIGKWDGFSVRQGIELFANLQSLDDLSDWAGLKRIVSGVIEFISVSVALLVAGFFWQAAYYEAPRDEELISQYKRYLKLKEELDQKEADLEVKP